MARMLNAQQVRAILVLYTQENWTVKELSTLFAVPRQWVSRIITGRTWHEITEGRNVSRDRVHTEYYCAHISARRAQGCTDSATIAQELGITAHEVRRLIKTKGL